VRLSLRARLGLLLAAFAVTAAGITGVVAWQQARGMLVAAAERTLSDTTHLYARRLSGAFAGIASDARALTRLKLAHDIAAEPKAAEGESHERLADTFEALLVTHPRYQQIRLIAAGGAAPELVRVDRRADEALRVTGDSLQPQAQQPHVNEALALARGEVLLSPIAGLRDATAPEALPQTTLQVSSPVQDEQGRTLALVVIAVDVTRLFADLRNDMPPRLVLLLADARGELLIHPDPWQSVAWARGRPVQLQQLFPEAAPLFATPANGAEAGVVLAQAELGSAEQVQPVLGAFMRVRLVQQAARGGELVLGVAEPLEEVLRSSRLLGRTALQIAAAVCLLTLLLAVVAARLVTRPLKQMTREVQRFAHERVIGELPTQRSDELGELARNVHQMQHRIRDSIDELAASREHLARQALRDPLTHLHNRAAFIERLEQAIAEARRQQRSLALLFLDLDRFKQVNDKYGHAVGDAALVHAARLLRSAVRDTDTVGRVGGDEFVILLEAAGDERDAGRVAELLLTRFAQPLRVGALEIELGLSIGISLYPRDGLDVSSLMQRADEAMYRSKGGAGNRYSVFGDL
jgi:diguanylate cyclase (GGDEF)-like protein